MKLFILMCSFLCFSLLKGEMTLEEKVGQLLIVHFNGSEVNQEAEKLIQEAYVGGFIYYNWANQLDSPQQVQALSQGLQALSQKVPLWIVVDQEGGAVNRLKKGFTIFPGNYALGRTQKPLLAEKSAYAIGRELKIVGVNVNLAPVVDVNSQPLNPVIGIRSFGEDPQAVTEWGEYALKGYQRAGVLAALKHYPGHGDTTIDSHDSLPTVKHTQARLEEVELYPFTRLSPLSDAILTSHLFVPALDPRNPVTFSSTIVKDRLRDQMQFEGLIMTDSLVMQGLLDQCFTIEEAAIRAFEAGHNLILLGGKQLLTHQNGLELNPDDVIRIHRALVAAVKEKRISQARLDESVNRILRMKEKYCAVTTSSLLELDQIRKENQQLAQQIAEASVSILQQKLPLPISLEKVVVIAPQFLKEEIEKTTLLGKNTEIEYFETLPSKKCVEKCLKADYTIICSYKSWKNKDLVKSFEELLKASQHAIMFIVGDPYDAELFPDADMLVETCSPSSASLQTALNLIQK